MNIESIQQLLEGRPLPLLTPTAVYDPKLSAAIHQLDCPEPVKAGLLLWNDDLDASHRLSQQIGTATGSYWHGIMHRREPDYSNSKYWFRRVGPHPAFQALAERARSEFGQAAYLAGGRYDPFAFVDACEAGARLADQADLRRFQLLEFRVLLEYCLANES